MNQTGADGAGSESVGGVNGSGPGPGPATGWSDGGATSYGDEASEAGCGSADCLPPTPAGWTGPIRWLTAVGEPPQCQAGERPIFDPLHAGLRVPELTCGCMCGIPSAPCHYHVGLHSWRAAGTTCGNETMTADSTDTSLCWSLPDTPEVIWALGSAQPNDAASCMASSHPADASPSWAEHGTACNIADPAACHDGGCPTADGGVSSACVLRAGNEPCPTDWPEREVYFAGFTDTRTCHCTCSEVTNFNCAGTVRFYGASCNADDLLGSAATGECVEMPSATERVRYSPTSVGQCSPNETVTGMVGEVEPFTVCCTQA